MATSKGSISRQTDNYVEILTRFGITPEVGPVWAGHGNTGRVSGWKLHLSSIPVQAVSLLEVLLPLLVQRGSSFKVVKSEHVLGLLNEGAFGETQVGKFVTIYPIDDRDFEELARMLITATDGFEGPIIPSDIQLGSVVYKRFGSFSPRIKRDKFGFLHPTIDLLDGSTGRDRYDVQRRPTEDDLGRGKNVFGPGYRIVGQLNDKAAGSTYIALDLRSHETVDVVVLKQGRRHYLSDSHGRDIRDRLKHQMGIANLLKGRVRTPQCLDYFEHHGDGYLAMQLVRGIMLLEWARGWQENDQRSRFLGVVHQMVKEVRAMHALGIVHRDLTPKNVLVDADGNPWLIDLELAYLTDSDETPFTEGTPGFASQQQIDRLPPQFSDDVYAIGCTIACLAAGVEIGVLKYSDHGRRAEQLKVLGGFSQRLARVVAGAMDPSRDGRPSLEAVDEALIAELSTPPAVRSRPQLLLPVDLSERLINGLLTHCLAPEGIWLSTTSDPKQRNAPEYGFRRSANRGVAGPLYALSMLAKRAGMAELVKPRVEKAVDWLLAHHATGDDQLPGLHFGEAGVAVSICQAVSNGVLEPGPWTVEYVTDALSARPDWHDVTHGAAGQGLACFRCTDLLSDSTLANLARPFRDYLLETQKENGSWVAPEGVPGMTGRTHSGFAHGVSGIVYFLIEYGARLRDAEAKDAAMKGLEWLTSVRRIVGSGDCAVWPIDTESEDVWHWWCHGGPGIALTYLHAYRLYGDPKYSSIARGALTALPTRIVMANLSQCHGQSGLGEIFLEAARVLRDEQYLEWARDIAAKLWQLRREAANGAVTWLVEDPHRPTADLMVGNAGVCHFLDRLQHPDSRTFPLLPSVRA